MTDESEGSRVHRHPDAADCLEGLPEDEAAVHPPPVRRHADGLTRCWIEDGQVRSRDVAGDGTPDALPGRSRRSSVRCRRGWRRTRARARPTWTGAGARSGTPRRAAARRRRGGAELLPGGWTRRGRRRSARPAAGRRPGIRRRRSPCLEPARPGRGGAVALPLPVVRQGVRPAGPGAWPGGRDGDAGDGERHRRDGAADGLRGGEPARRQPRRCGRVVERAAAPGAGSRRGGGPLRARGGRRRQAAGIAHAALRRRDRRPDAEGGDRGRSRQAGRRHLEDPRCQAGGGVHGRGAGPRDRRGGQGPGQRVVRLPDRRRGGAVRRPGGLGLRGAARPGGPAAGAARRGRARRRLRRGGLDHQRLRGALRGPEGHVRARPLPLPGTRLRRREAILPAGAERDRRFAEARPTSGRAGRRRPSGSWRPSGTGTRKSRRAAGISRGTSAGCGTTGTAIRASRSGAASSRADAGGSGCGSSDRERAGRRGAPTPCWR